MRAIQWDTQWDIQRDIQRYRQSRFSSKGFWTAVALALTVGIFACCLSVFAASSIKIGTSVSLSGSYREPSVEQFQGLMLWKDHVNAAGGIQVGPERRMVEIIRYDDGSDVTRIQGIYEKLIHVDEVDFLFSPYSSSMGAAVAQVAANHDMIALLPGSASEEIFSRGYTTVYQLYPRGSSYFVPAVTSIAAKNPAARVSFLFKDDPFSRSTVSGARDLARQLGLSIVFDVAYDENIEDFSSLIAQLAATNPDALIGGGHVVDGLALAQQLHEAGVRPDVIALLAAPASPQFAELGDAADGVIYPSPWEPGLGYEPTFGPTSETFVKAYREKYGEVPQYFAASGYNAGLILQHAIEKAGSLDPQAVRLALDATDLVTFYGAIRFSTDPDDHGMQIGHTGVIVQWKRDADGRLVKQVVGREGF